MRSDLAVDALGFSTMLKFESRVSSSPPAVEFWMWGLVQLALLQQSVELLPPLSL